MNGIDKDQWLEQNQHYLMAAIAQVQRQLQDYYEQSLGNGTCQQQTNLSDDQQIAFPQQLPPPALETLCQDFGLSSFERNILLLCAGAELDSSFADVLNVLSLDSKQSNPVFSLALALFSNAHWSALAPNAALRYWRLIEVGAGTRLSNSPLKIDERILHFLTGVSYLDSRLQGMIRPVQQSQKLLGSRYELAKKMAELWRHCDMSLPSPIIQLTGGQHTSKQIISSTACTELGLQIHTIQSRDIPLNPVERDALSRLWEREAVLSESALLVNCETLENQAEVMSFLENTHGIIVVSTHESIPLHERSSLSIEVPKSSTQEQLKLWHQAIGAKAKKLNGQLEHIAWQFQMDTQDINAVSAQMLNTDSTLESDEFGEKLWHACRVQARQRLDQLAQRIEPLAHWEDLVLPQAQLKILAEISIHVRQRAKVYQQWGFAAKGSRGLGISALFSGPSGTGKTMTAEVLANELRLDLYRIDLSQIVNKYIGETEKNLRKVFDTAEQSGAILLFDEADALFGKRSDVKDSHDRYSNIECSYLLQRMEAYSGFSILTSNMKQALDQAFLRRIRFAVQFPFPNAEQRIEIWRRIFPRQTPTEGLDFKTLSKLDVAGGNIHNVAMNAAFLAAEEEQPVGMKHIEQAARGEYIKLEKPMTGSEFSANLQNVNSRHNSNANKNQGASRREY